MSGTIKRVATCGEDIALAEKMKMILLNAFARDSDVFSNVRDLHHWVEGEVITIFVNKEVVMHYEVSAVEISPQTYQSATLAAEFDCIMITFSFDEEDGYDLVVPGIDMALCTLSRQNVPLLFAVFNTKYITGVPINEIEAWEALEERYYDIIANNLSPDFEVRGEGICYGLSLKFNYYYKQSHLETPYRISFLHDDNESDRFLPFSQVYLKILYLFLSVDSLYSYKYVNNSGIYG